MLIDVSGVFMPVTLDSSSVVAASSGTAMGSVVEDLANGILRASTTLSQKDPVLVAEGIRSMEQGAAYGLSHADKVSGPNVPTNPKGRSR